jgi:hypothetical protein
MTATGRRRRERRSNPAGCTIRDLGRLLGDFSWLGPALLGHTGQPIHYGTAAELPGVWYIGQRWLTRRSSGNFFGFPADAAIIATAVAATLRERPVRTAPIR